MATEGKHQGADNGPWTITCALSRDGTLIQTVRGPETHNTEVVPASLLAEANEKLALVQSKTALDVVAENMAAQRRARDAEDALAEALAERDSLRLERDAVEANRLRDNTYLLAERDRLASASRVVLREFGYIMLEYPEGQDLRVALESIRDPHWPPSPGAIMGEGPTLVDRVAWAIHVSRGSRSPRKDWAEMSDVDRAELNELAETIIFLCERFGGDHVTTEGPGPQ